MASNIPDGGNGKRSYVPAGPPPGAPEQLEPEGLTLRDYLGVLWRRKWIILLVMVVATTSAYFFSARQAKQYEAAASLIYEKSVDVANPLSEAYIDTYALDREMSAINDIIASPEMQERAGAILEEEGVDESAGYAVSSSAQTSDSGGNANSGSNVVLHLRHQRGPGAGRGGGQRLRQRPSWTGARSARRCRSRRPPTPSRRSCASTRRPPSRRPTT